MEIKPIVVPFRLSRRGNRTPKKGVPCARCGSRRSLKRPCKRCERLNLANRQRYDWHKGLPKNTSLLTITSE